MDNNQKPKLNYLKIILILIPIFIIVWQVCDFVSYVLVILAQDHISGSMVRVVFAWHTAGSVSFSLFTIGLLAYASVKYPDYFGVIKGQTLSRSKTSRRYKSILIIPMVFLALVYVFFYVSFDDNAGGNAGEKLKNIWARFGPIENLSISQKDRSIIIQETDREKITQSKYLGLVGLVCSAEGENPGTLSGILEIQVLNSSGTQGYLFNGGSTECLRVNSIIENLKGIDAGNRDEVMEAIEEGSKKQKEYILSLTQFRNGM